MVKTKVKAEEQEVHSNWSEESIAVITVNIRCPHCNKLLALALNKVTVNQS